MGGGMHESKIYGWALIASAVGLVATGLFHPTHLHAASPGAMEHLLRLATGIHVLVLAAIWLSLVGLIGLSRQLGIGSPAVAGALAAYGIGVLAAFCAAILSGFVMPELARSHSAADDAARQGMKLMADYSVLLNGAFSKVHIVGASLAILLWSMAILRKGFSKILAFVGFASLLLPVAVVLNGRLHMSVHELLGVVLVEGVWLTWAGVLLIRNLGVRHSPAQED
jgi:hypothetical protein